jgi:hypothetical protein
MPIPFEMVKLKIIKVEITFIKHIISLYMTHRFHMQNAKVGRSSHYLTWHHPIWIGSIKQGIEKTVNMPGIAYQRQTIFPFIGMPTQWHNTFFINRNAKQLSNRGLQFIDNLCNEKYVAHTRSQAVCLPSMLSYHNSP